MTIPESTPEAEAAAKAAREVVERVVWARLTEGELEDLMRAVDAYARAFSICAFRRFEDDRLATTCRCGHVRSSHRYGDGHFPLDVNADTSCRMCVACVRFQVAQ